MLEYNPIEGLALIIGPYSHMGHILFYGACLFVTLSWILNTSITPTSQGQRTYHLFQI